VSRKKREEVERRGRRGKKRKAQGRRAKPTEERCGKQEEEGRNGKKREYEGREEAKQKRYLRIGE